MRRKKVLLCWLPLATVATIAALWSSLYWSASAEGMVTVARDDFCNRGRLGNKMFHVASAFGIAERSNATFVLEEDSTMCNWTFIMQDLFEGVSAEVKIVPASHTRSWSTVNETQYMQYDDIRVQNNDKLQIRGYRQNYRYFIDSKNALRRLFQFRQHYVDVADKLKRELLQSFSDIRQPVLVGVHVRIGDIMEQELQSYGYNVARKSFFEKSMSIMANRHGRDRIIFVITSDTMSEAKATMSNLSVNYNVFFVEGKLAHEDFAILSSMDHMVTSGGTFGFWAAWLCGGDVIYFSEYCTPGSELEKEGYCMTCFNLPEWLLSPIKSALVILRYHDTKHKQAVPQADSTANRQYHRQAVPQAGSTTTCQLCS